MVHSNIVGSFLKTGRKEKKSGEGKKKTPQPDLLYCFTSKKPHASIFNVSQVAGEILNSSRFVFLGTMEKMLSVLDPRRCQLAYVDTDSYLILLHDKENSISSKNDLSSLLSPLVSKVEGEKVLDQIFEDPNSLAHQSGLLKIEGIYRAGYFRSSKCYYLRTSQGEELRRMKGIPRRTHKLLHEDLFGQNPEKNQACVRTVSMRPSLDAAQIFMLDESRCLSHALNLKRRAIVSSHRIYTIV